MSAGAVVLGNTGISSQKCGDVLLLAAQTWQLKYVANVKINTAAIGLKWYPVIMSPVLLPGEIYGRLCQCLSDQEVAFRIAEPVVAVAGVG